MNNWVNIKRSPKTSEISYNILIEYSVIMKLIKMIKICLNKVDYIIISAYINILLIHFKFSTEPHSYPFRHCTDWATAARDHKHDFLFLCDGCYWIIPGKW